MTPAQLFAQFLTQCEGGFDNEHHWREWKKKHDSEINMLPVPLKKRVLMAWEQATAKEFSGGPGARLSRGLNGSDAEAGPPIPDANESEP